MTTQHLFLLGTGRSGTTLIQRILNTYPGTMIWGEHAGFLTQLAETYFTLKDNPSLHEFSYQASVDEGRKFDVSAYNDPAIWQAWTNWFRPEDINDMFRKILDEIFKPDQFGVAVWGFKEIRYGPNDRVIEFLSEIYPEAVFLFITRDSLNNVESQLTNFHYGQSKFLRLKRILQLPTLAAIANEWRHQNAYYIELSEKKSHTHFLIRYEDAIRNLHLLDEPLSKLGLSIGEKQLSILDVKEGRGSNAKLGKNVNARWKRMGLVPAFVVEMITGCVGKKLGYSRETIFKPATILSHIFFR